jgi:hypothetical protein
MDRNNLNRRTLLGVAAGGLALSALPELAHAQFSLPDDGTLRDRLWLFATATNAAYPHTQRRSVMSPAEGAYYLGIPNVIMVQSNKGAESEHGRFNPPFEQYAFGLRPLKRVLWSLVGSGGFTSPEERKEGLELVRRTPNFVGVYLDDFFTTKAEGQRAFLTVEELRRIRDILKAANRKLEIHVTYYTGLLELPLSDYLELIDGITLWTWRHQDLANLESNFRRAEKVAPRLKKMLGCYLIDFTTRQSVPIPAMQHQCELGLRLLREHRIEGMVFLGNCVIDHGLPSVDWTRNWIERAGTTRL